MSVLQVGAILSVIRSLPTVVQNTRELHLVPWRNTFLTMSAAGPHSGLVVAARNGNDSLDLWLDDIQESMPLEQILTLVIRRCSVFNKKMHIILQRLTALTAILVVNNRGEWDDDVLLALFWYCEDDLTPLCPLLPFISGHTV